MKLYVTVPIREDGHTYYFFTITYYLINVPPCRVKQEFRNPASARLVSSRGFCVNQRLIRLSKERLTRRPAYPPSKAGLHKSFVGSITHFITHTAGSSRDAPTGNYRARTPGQAIIGVRLAWG